MDVACNALFLVLLLLAGQSNPQLATPGTEFASSQQDYDNGFDNPFLKTLSPNWQGPRYWWLTSVKKDHFQTVFSNATSNPEINVQSNTNNITQHFNSRQSTNTENINSSDNLSSSHVPSLGVDITYDDILVAFGNKTSFEGTSVDIDDGPFGDLEVITTSTSTSTSTVTPQVPVTQISISPISPQISVLQNTENYPDCDCLKYYNCFENGTIKTKGENLLGDRIGKTEVDCKPDERFCCLAGTAMPEMGCGRQTPNLFPDRILPNINDTTYPGEFPWMVTLLVEKNNGRLDSIRLPNYYQCGGAIIDRSVILTAAHCLQNNATGDLFPPNALQIRAGVWNVADEEEPVQNRDVINYTIHPDYYSASLVYDYALLLLNEPLEFGNGRIGKICLPDKEEDLSQSPECVVTGWGRNKLENGEMRPILKKLNISLVGHEECQRKLRTTRLTVYYQLDDSFICAGGIAGMDTCKGDGGSPLVCKPPGSNVFHLTGLVSWGIECGKEIPGVYSNVGKNVKWIMDTKDNLLQSQNKRV